MMDPDCFVDLGRAASPDSYETVNKFHDILNGLTALLDFILQSVSLYLRNVMSSTTSRD